MATKHWQGQATAVAQIDTVQITAFDVATTYTLTVGLKTVSTIGVTDADGTATALAAAWEASTDPYFANVSASATTDTVTLTALTAGVPFIAASSVTGGTGTIGAVTSSTASAGPNDWSTATNWSDDTVPVSTDTVVFQANTVDVLWGFAQSAVDLTLFQIFQSYTGKIGLPEDQFTTAATTTDTSVPEYRATYLAVGSATLRIGEHFGSGAPAGSSRLKIDLGTDLNTGIITNSSTSSADTFLEPIRLLGVNSSNVLHVLKGNVGIASTVAGEVSTWGTINVSHQGNITGDSKANIASGVTITALTQSGGTILLQTAVPNITQTAGELTTTGTGAISGVITVGGTAFLGSTGLINSLIVTSTGKADFSRDSQDKTVSALVLHAGSTLNIDNGAGSALSITLSAGIDFLKCSADDVTLITGDDFSFFLVAI